MLARSTRRRHEVIAATVHAGGVCLATRPRLPLCPNKSFEHLLLEVLAGARLKSLGWSPKKIILEIFQREVIFIFSLLRRLFIECAGNGCVQETKATHSVAALFMVQSFDFFPLTFPLAFS